jgi:membrane-associated phospholipid phosphatase
VLGVALRDRDGLWEYAFTLQVCSVVTIVVFALWPAACVFTTLDFHSLLDQTRFIDHFSRLRAGSLTIIRYDDIEGLVSCPSFHVALGWIVTWVFRRYRLLCGTLMILNAALTASTVLLGAHYAVDLPASALMVGASIWLYRRWGRALMNRPLPVLRTRTRS